MTTVHQSCLEQIGDAAGTVWHHLSDQGPRTLAELAKELDVPRDVLMQAVGWLVREDKILIEEESRGRKKVVALR